MLIVRFFFLFFLAISTPLFADPIRTSSIEEMRTHVQRLHSDKTPPSEIGVIFDFHGVITTEPSHSPTARVRERVIPFLQYLQSEGIPFCIATAWNNFIHIRDDVVRLGLGGFFEIDPIQAPSLETFSAGRDDSIKLTGYKNGRVVALKYRDSSDPYFRQKAFAFDVVFPGTHPKYVLLVDDSQDNLTTAKQDFPSTACAAAQSELVSFYLVPPPAPPAILVAQAAAADDDDDSSASSSTSSAPDLSQADSLLAPPSRASLEPYNDGSNPDLSPAGRR